MRAEDIAAYLLRKPDEHLTMTIIAMAEGTHYMTITECMVSNAERHEANAERHRVLGHPEEWAQGSLRKAAKNYNRAWNLGWRGEGEDGR